MRPKLTVTLLLVFSLVCLGQKQKSSGNPDGARPEHSPFEGAKIFQYHCAACHGADGRGHGPAAVALKNPLPDITLISQKNDGKFPTQRVRDYIEGPNHRPIAHGTREMPVWGPIFHQIEADQDWGEVRLSAVTRHIESIQQK